MRIVALVLVLLTSPLALAQDRPDDPSLAAKIYLNALKASDLMRVEAVTTSSMLEWTRRYMAVLYSYEVRRADAVCSEPLSFQDVVEHAASYLELAARFQDLMRGFLDRRTEAPSTDEMRALSDRMKAARAAVATRSTCLATVLDRTQVVGLISPQALRGLSGVGAVEMSEIIIDVERPGRGGSKATERRSLSVARLRGETFDSGWKAIAFGVFRP